MNGSAPALHPFRSGDKLARLCFSPLHLQLSCHWTASDAVHIRVRKAERNPYKLFFCLDFPTLCLTLRQFFNVYFGISA